MPLLRDFFTALPMATDYWTMVRLGVVRRLVSRQPELKRKVGLRLLMALEKRSARKKEPSLARIFEQLGPNWIKLGQFLATRQDIFGPEIAEDLSALQDKLRPFDPSLAEATVEATLGRPADEIFEDFGPAVAAASIAQVHRARIRTGGGG